MKLIRKPSISPIAKEIAILPKQEKSQKKEPKKKSNIPPDVYKDEIEPFEVIIDDARKIVLSVKRGGELGLPALDVRQFQTTELYEGFTKKGINIPLELLVDIIDALQGVFESCEKKKLFDEL